MITLLKKPLKALSHLCDLYRFKAAWLPRVKHGTPVYEQGYTILDNMLSAEECARIRRDFDGYLHEKLPDVASGSYIVGRRQSANRYDQHVFQMMNYEKVAPWIVERLQKPVLSALKEQIGHDFIISSYSIQVDWPDTQTKRGYHCDGFSPTYKVFVYLNDVLDRADGPYTVIPRSHHHVGRKVANVLLNLFRPSIPLDNMDNFYDDNDSHSILAKAGSAIVSCQVLAHKGWHGHSGQKRYALILYVRPTHLAQEEWTLGKDLRLTKTVSPEEAEKRAA